MAPSDITIAINHVGDAHEVAASIARMVRREAMRRAALDAARARAALAMSTRAAHDAWEGLWQELTGRSWARRARVVVSLGTLPGGRDCHVWVDGVDLRDVLDEVTIVRTASADDRLELSIPLALVEVL